MKAATRLNHAQGAAGAVLILRDQFTTTEAAPLASPRTCEPGPGTLTLVDLLPSQDATIAVGKYERPKPTSNQAYASYGLYSAAALARTVGLACYAKWRSSNLSGLAPVAWNTAAALAAGVQSIICENFGTSVIDHTGGGTVVAGTLSNNTDYRCIVVLRGAGAVYLIRGGAFTDWTILWVGAVNTGPSMYPMSPDFNSQASLDTFAVAQLAGSLSREYGHCTAMDPTPVDGDVLNGTADGLTYFTWTVVAGETLSLRFRRVDDNNCYRLDCAQAAGTIKLYRVVSGVDTELASGKTQTWTAGAQYRIGVVCAGGDIRTFTQAANVGPVAKHAVTGESVYLTEVGAKASGFAAGANWERWPRTITDPVLDQLESIV